MPPAFSANQLDHARRADSRPRREITASRIVAVRNGLEKFVQFLQRNPTAFTFQDCPPDVH
ncbi:hypothetical protein AMATHDRAFT_593 [Amanita thiersii Skay4041]|uniref:Uncharacterized protein n=1 Tax=Amanita thiersii Skay4041 TaxID=703135 RepID=A0A2A9P170_9AGAR|nr:hypothetical protein AMATHDRAFT_593 [Amanita thiersii Skay4041]